MCKKKEKEEKIVENYSSFVIIALKLSISTENFILIINFVMLEVFYNELLKYGVGLFHWTEEMFKVIKGLLNAV